MTSAAPRWVWAAGLAAAFVQACSEVPAGGTPRSPDEVPISRPIEGGELLPGDLDVVIRLDLERLREGLGSAPEAELASRLSPDSLMGRALGKARAITVGLRAQDLGLFDHVIVLEGDMRGLEFDRTAFEQIASANEKVTILVKTEPVARPETQALVLLGDHAIAFVSPVETDAVLRVLRQGPDASRGDPSMEGLLSADIQPRRLDPLVERRYPSIARLVREVRRLRGVVRGIDEGVKIELELIAKSAQAAGRIERFIGALREGARPEGSTAFLSKMSVERIEASVRVRVVLPPDLVLTALRGAADGPPEDPGPP